MEKFDAEMKEAGEASDAAWSQDGSLRAMRTVLQERDAAALVELDKIDLMSQMMGGGGRGMGGMGGMGGWMGGMGGIAMKV